jgi:hypothetical protein
VGGSWHQDEVTPGNSEEDRKNIAEAVKVAQKADAVFLAIGGNEQTSREAWKLDHLGDRASLDMVGRQDELVDAITATGKPIIAFLFRCCSEEGVASRTFQVAGCASWVISFSGYEKNRVRAPFFLPSWLHVPAWRWN